MFYLLILLLQMKLIKHITDLNKAVNSDKELGFVPTMGNLHKGHESLIKMSKKKCKKTMVSIFINPTQFNNKEDYEAYPRSLKRDLKVLKILNVDYVYLPTVTQIFKGIKKSKISLKKSDKILCAKFRKGHFEGVLDILNRFVKLISPEKIFMGEKDFQQFFLVKKFIEKKYKSKVFQSKTIRNSNKVALSSRNNLLNQTNLKVAGLITNKLLNLKRSINKNKNRSNKLIEILKEDLIQKFNIEIEYLECRNLNNLSTNIYNKPFKLFVAYYLNNVRLIDNF
ncbi:pantoate--beta-alanine ligase [Candidatus Pelagibacter sp.]|jgi:pantoate--beta-alanine ligase|nr:pantoate--beta-alanine ligase [Candidatus Pelagibacter sp.]